MNELPGKQVDDSIRGCPESVHHRERDQRDNRDDRDHEKQGDLGAKRFHLCLSRTLTLAASWYPPLRIVLKI